MRKMRHKYRISLSRTLLLMTFASLLAGGCTASLPSGRVAGGETYTNRTDFQTGGFRRAYRLHVPPGYPSGAPIPLVVVVHGAFDTAEGVERASGFSRLADRENFAVLYPEGIGILGFLQHWNAGHCCGKAAADGIDDVGFVASAIGDVCRHLAIDRDRIFMAGFSNGGMLVYRFAAERGELLAAAAPLAASIGGRADAEAPEWRIPEPVRPLPLIVMHGLGDDDVRYEGGASIHRGGGRTYLPVEESAAFWVRRNGCAPRAAEQRLYDGRVLLKSWSACANDADVALYLIEGWGHVWPGRNFTGALADDDPLRGFDAAEVIWSFFRAHPRR